MPCDEPEIPWDQQQGYDPRKDGHVGCGNCGLPLRKHEAPWMRGQKDTLRKRVLRTVERMGWSLNWTDRCAALHLEASELTEAVRGKRGDTLEESADVLITLLAHSPHELDEIVSRAERKLLELVRDRAAVNG